MLTAAGSLASCSSDYLDQPPITSVSQEELGNSITAARAALYGACQAMNIGTYREINDRNNCGEAWFQTYYGDAASPDFWDSFLWGYQEEMQNWTLMVQDQSYASVNGWMYGYNLINQSNVILDNIDNIEGNEAEKLFIKAQALTIRAHGYVRMMQVYAPRYEDRQDGKALCLVIRTHAGVESLPLSTYDEVIAQIYSDLDTAIEYYTTSQGKRTYGYEPDINVARGIYTRIALMNHDWQKVVDMGEAARASYPIMTADDYMGGFGMPTSEWMWYNDKDPQMVGYRSWGSAYSCNGAYVLAYNWSGAGNISYKFYKQIYDRHNDDVRCRQFWTPETANMFVNMKIKAADFWNPEKINSEYGYMYGYKMDGDMACAISLFVRHNNPDSLASHSGMQKYQVLQDGVLLGTAYGVDQSLTDKVAANPIQRKNWSSKITGNKDMVNTVQFGAQVKFWTFAEIYGCANHSFLRASEILLSEAEAQYELGREKEARDLLIELNNQRIPNYTCDLTGEALRDEIRLYRRIELWGEGDAWFSFKRWNIGVSREAWVENDPNSDSFLSAYKGSWDASYSGGWRYQIPKAEINYNPAVADQLNEIKGK